MGMLHRSLSNSKTWDVWRTLATGEHAIADPPPKIFFWRLLVIPGELCTIGRE